MDDGKWDGILSAAATAFARFGFRKTSMDEIAKAAGVAKGTLYLGCESKRDLLYQVILRDLRIWNAELLQGLDPRVPADELLVRMAQDAFGGMDRFPLARDLILGKFEQDLPDWLDHLDELRAHGLTTNLEILRIGVRQGRFRDDLDLEEVAGVLLDLITTTMMFHARGPNADQRLVRRAAATFDLVINGLKARKPSRTPASTSH